METKRYLRAKEVKALYGFSLDTLAQWRYQRRGPPFTKPSATIVLYPVDQLEAWLADRTASSTAEAARKAADRAA